MAKIRTLAAKTRKPRAKSVVSRRVKAAVVPVAIALTIAVLVLSVWRQLKPTGLKAPTAPEG